MTREALADRIINYCDALAAFSLVNALAFVITLAEPDIRCSVASIAGVVVAANGGVAVLVTAALIALRRFERSLRPAEKAEPRIEGFWRMVQATRIALVWIVLLFVTSGLWAATQDPLCAAAGS